MTMTAEALTALLSGSVLGFSYAFAGYFMSRRAQTSPEKFMLWVAGGMLVRMFVALTIIAVVLATVPMQTTIFLGVFLTIFVLGIIVEIAVAHRS